MSNDNSGQLDEIMALIGAEGTPEPPPKHPDHYVLSPSGRFSDVEFTLTTSLRHFTDSNNLERNDMCLHLHLEPKKGRNAIFTQTVRSIERDILNEAIILGERFDVLRDFVGKDVISPRRSPALIDVPMFEPHHKFARDTREQPSGLLHTSSWTTLAGGAALIAAIKTVAECGHSEFWLAGELKPLHGESIPDMLRRVYSAHPLQFARAAVHNDEDNGVINIDGLNTASLGFAIEARAANKHGVVVNKSIPMTEKFLLDSENPHVAHYVWRIILHGGELHERLSLVTAAASWLGEAISPGRHSNEDVRSAISAGVQLHRALLEKLFPSEHEHGSPSARTDTTPLQMRSPSPKRTRATGQIGE